MQVTHSPHKSSQLKTRNPTVTRHNPHTMNNIHNAVCDTHNATIKMALKSKLKYSPSLSSTCAYCRKSLLNLQPITRLLSKLYAATSINFPRHFSNHYLTKTKCHLFHNPPMEQLQVNKYSKPCLQRHYKSRTPRPTLSSDLSQISPRLKCTQSTLNTSKFKQIRYLIFIYSLNWSDQTIHHNHSEVHSRSTVELEPREEKSTVPATSQRKFATLERM
jgi:hypothetical protein